MSNTFHSYSLFGIRGDDRVAILVRATKKSSQGYTEFTILQENLPLKDRAGLS